MSYKVIRNNGSVVCFGPNEDGYEPSLKEGDVLNIEESAPAPDLKAEIRAKIDQIERQTLMNRVTREFLLAMAEAQAQGQGVTKEQLYQINLGYRRTKDVDTQIAQLRAQL